MPFDPGSLDEVLFHESDHQSPAPRTGIRGVEVDLDVLPPSDMTFIEPMLVQPVSQLPEGPNWQYEIKWDGFRGLAIRAGGTTALVSRRNHSFVQRFPSIAAALGRLEDGCMLDGEIVALDANGAPSFHLLQYRAPKPRALVYLVFDIVAFRSRDVRRLELVQRRGLLEAILKHAPDNVRGAPILDASPGELIRAVKAQGLEGIVAKRRDSRYESRGRSGAWVKFRVNQDQDLVVGGYRIGHGGVAYLAVGYYDARDRLVFLAKINAGCTPRILARLRQLATPTCPFEFVPEATDQYRWIKPELVAAVEFAEWTSDSHLRHARFLALRDDKDPWDVRIGMVPGEKLGAS